MKHGIARFFKYARARHQVYLNREMGLPREKWTKDPILSQFRFTNVFRELDKTTAWMRQYVRDPRRNNAEVLLATVVFRLLNRIEVGEAIFCQTMLPTGRFNKRNTPITAFDAFSTTGSAAVLKHAIKTALPKGPHVTGAYIISSPAGYTKLDGMMEVIERFYKQSRDWPIQAESLDQNMNWREAADLMLANPGEEYCSLKSAWEWLSQFDYLGSFHSYEIVTDLRHTALLSSAPDIMSWANPGPGARRGANRVMGRDVRDKSVRRAGLIEEMQEILAHSKEFDLWPGKDLRGQVRYKPEDWPVWEMRDVEHTLCEFDKYERVRLGEGRPRGVYR